MKNFAMWYFLLGVITVLIGGFRNWRGKQVVEPDPMTVLSWFFVPWFYLGMLGFKYFVILKNNIWKK